jgi:hypothetical protein
LLKATHEIIEIRKKNLQGPLEKKKVIIKKVEIAVLKIKYIQVKIIAKFISKAHARTNKQNFN